MTDGTVLSAPSFLDLHLDAAPSFVAIIKEIVFRYSESPDKALQDGMFRFFIGHSMALL